MRFYIIPNPIPVKLCHKCTSIAFAGDICIAAGLKIGVELIIWLISGIAYYGNDILYLLLKIIHQHHILYDSHILLHIHIVQRDQLNVTLVTKLLQIFGKSGFGENAEVILLTLTENICIVL